MNRDAFAAMISGLEKSGVSRPEIQRRTGLSKNTIWRFATGYVREPKFESVEKLLKLAAKVEKPL